jgi:hypothetical protein
MIKHLYVVKQIKQRIKYFRILQKGSRNNLTGLHKSSVFITKGTEPYRKWSQSTCQLLLIAYNGLTTQGIMKHYILRIVGLSDI